MKYNRDYHVDYGYCDYSGNLSIRSILEITEASVAANFGLMGCDNLTLRTKHDAMWVFVKNHISIDSTPKWNDPFKVECYCISFKKLKCVIETDFINEKGEIFAYSILECCCLDIHSHQLRKLDTIPFPMDYECPVGKEYSFRGRVEATYTFVENALVRSQDVDYSRHLNNVNYVRYILNTYSVDELSHMKLKSMEIYYIRETEENSILSINKYEENGIVIFSLKKEDTEVCCIHIQYEKTE